MEREKNLFDSNWRERLNNYRLTPEFRKNFKLLKEELDKSLPKEKPERKLVFVFKGIPGSGKTTIAKIIKENLYPSVILQSDWIFFEKLRKQIGNDYYKAYVYQEELAKNYLQDGYSVIMDDNSQTVKNRQEIYKIAKLNGAKPILININVDLKRAANRVTLKGKENKTEKEIIESLKIFKKRTEVISEKEKVNIMEINGNKTLSEIAQTLKSAIFQASLGKNL
jgi:predicted kinase